MKLAISFEKKPKVKADTIIVAVYKDGKLGEAAKKLDRECGGLIAQNLKGQKKFTGKAGQVMVLTPSKGPSRIVLAGLGDTAKMELADWEAAGGKLYPIVAASAKKAAIHLDEGSKKVPADAAAAAVASGFRLRSYNFLKYKTGKKKDDDGFGALEVVTGAAAKAGTLFKARGAVADGVFFARDCVNEPPNNLYPDSFARMIAKELKPLGVQVEIFDEKKMQKLGFHAHLAVGMGSSRKPRVVVMRWNGGKKGKAPLALVGKGVTFDTGGVNLKPADGMLDMKMDMAGAAAVAGTMRALAKRKAKANVVGIVGLAENMPSHIAYRPSDIIGSLAGKTIEVMNTDAEGRLVLADCLTYVQRTDKPSAVIDLATLTGAMMIALGHEYCGTFANDDNLWKNLDGASKRSGEKLWRMPLDEAFKKETEGFASDIKSTGNGRYGGSCTAAGFLERFIEGNTPWAHLDIAGTAWLPRDTATGPRPATGFGVRLLNQLVADIYES